MSEPTRVFRTINTEYHVRAGHCVAVIDRGSGRQVPAHRALRQPLAGALRLSPRGGFTVAGHVPCPGDSLVFRSRSHDVLTSPLTEIIQTG